MSHWFDDTARGLASGTYSRRDVLRWSGAAAGSALFRSLLAPIRRVDAVKPCGKGSRRLICDGTDWGCVSPEAECCGAVAYNSEHGHCCGGKRVCPKGNGCCGAHCLEPGEECCYSGTLAYAAPKGQCCPHGQHRVTCGTGQTICCPEGQYCDNGQCGCPAPQFLCRNTSNPDDPGTCCASGWACCEPGDIACSKTGYSVCCKPGYACYYGPNTSSPYCEAVCKAPG